MRSLPPSTLCYAYVLDGKTIEARKGAQAAKALFDQFSNKKGEAPAPAILDSAGLAKAWQGTLRQSRDGGLDERSAMRAGGLYNVVLEVWAPWRATTMTSTLQCWTRSEETCLEGRGNGEGLALGSV